MVHLQEALLPGALHHSLFSVFSCTVISPCCPCCYVSLSFGLAGLDRVVQVLLICPIMCSFSLLALKLRQVFLDGTLHRHLPLRLHMTSPRLSCGCEASVYLTKGWHRADILETQPQVFGSGEPAIALHASTLPRQDGLIWIRPVA
ncbi:hypothetical protein BKA66DRAFT_476781 [Pyrenochaeta sp. MPI-SDFR-AT-0127]|nr:hypothetical protein BKA66DRAFT_476781 [Pyrenochaeta sp. MPI-SDFR-AT-0127]